MSGTGKLNLVTELLPGLEPPSKPQKARAVKWKPPATVTPIQSRLLDVAALDGTTDLQTIL